MPPRKQINALVMTIGNYWLMIFCMMLICLSILALFIFLGLKYDKLWVILIGIPLFIIPVIFIRVRINLVVKKAAILFSEEFIEFKNSGTLNETFIYSDIKYFSASKYDVDNAFTIKFTLRNGRKKKYIFFRQLDNDENILNNVLLYFSSFNIGKIQEAKIQIFPSFYLTKQGKIFVAVTGFIILAAIIIQIIYKPKVTPASLLMLLGAYLQTKSIQMSDRKILEKFRDGN